MEIDGLLNSRHSAVTDARLRQQFTDTMQLDNQPYNMSQSQNHQHIQLHSNNPLQYQIMQQSPHSQSQIYSANLGATQQNMKQEAHMDNAEYAPLKPTKSGNAEKKFTCKMANCTKTFARKSDLARHG
jgi:hypothetical protein